MRRSNGRSSKFSIVILTLSLLVITFLVGKVDTVQDLLTRASGTKANLIVDTKGNLGPVNRVWQNLSQGGESPTYRFQPVQSQVAALSPQYIRIDHLYDFYDIVQRQPDNSIHYNWQQLDIVLNDITSLGATPFISLSYMPKDLGNGDITGAPTNYREWQDLVRETIRHVSGRPGLNLQNVYYEVWNEPDLFGHWKTYGDKNYLELYRYAALGAKEVREQVQPFKFGGPATTALYPNWVTNLLDLVSSQNLPLDFYSWHRYAYHLETYENDLETFDQLLRQYPDYLFTTEAIISEMGPTPAIDPVYDGALSAAHQVALSIQLAPTYVDRAFAFEVQDGKDPAGQEFWGRWGLLTHQDFGSTPKPRYHALELLNRLGAERLSLVGDGTWVKALATTDPQSSSFQLLIVNYDPLAAHVETVPITLRRLVPGQYQKTQQYLGRNATTEIITVQDSSYQFELTLPVNSIVFLEFKPIP